MGGKYACTLYYRVGVTLHYYAAAEAIRSGRQKVNNDNAGAGLMTRTSISGGSELQYFTGRCWCLGKGRRRERWLVGRLAVGRTVWGPPSARLSEGPEGSREDGDKRESGGKAKDGGLGTRGPVRPQRR